MLYSPGSTLQLVPGGPHVVLSGEERDGAFIVVVAQKGFYPWNKKQKKHSVGHRMHANMFYLLFNLTVIIPDKTIKSKILKATHH